jgi:hypothetical protein
MSNFNVGNLIYKITGDSSSLDKSLKTSNTKMSTFGKTISSVSDTLKTVFVSGAVALAAKKVLNIGLSLVSVASDAEETKNKFTVVFEDVADQAEEASKRIEDEFKLSESSTEKFLSQVGDITTGLGATSDQALEAAEKITTLGLDINSFANLSGGAEQAVSALTSLFTGEREAAKALGIVINDTNLKAYAEDMGKVYSELTPLEKGFLSLELATSQSQLAIGDFARSSDSYANTAKAAAESTLDLKSAIGQSLLPAATESLKIFTSITDALTEQITKHNELRTLLDKFEDDVDTAADRVELAEREIAITQKLYDENYALLKLNATAEQQNEYTEQALDLLYEKSTALNVELRAKQALLEVLKEEAAAEKAVADEIKAKQEAAAKAIQDEIDAAEKLDSIKALSAQTLSDLQTANLSDQEKEIQNIQTQIDYWAGLRSEYSEVSEIQKIINELIADRNALTETSTETEQTFYNQFKGYKEDELLSIYNNREAAVEAADEIIEKNKEVMVSYEDLASVGLSAITSGFADIGEAIADGSLGIDDFAALLLDAISSTLTALGSQLAAQAIAHLLLGDVSGAAIGAAGSAAAYTAAGVVSGLAGSYESGGIIPGTSTTGDNLTANVNSGEMVLNKKQQASLFSMANSGGTTSGTTNYYLMVDGNPLKATIQSWINNNQLRGKNGSL